MSDKRELVGSFIQIVSERNTAIAQRDALAEALQWTVGLIDNAIDISDLKLLKQAQLLEGSRAALKLAGRE